MTEFAHGGFRILHQNLPDTSIFLDKKFERIKKVVSLGDMFAPNASQLLQTEYNDFLRGMIGQPIRYTGYGYVFDVCRIYFKIFGYIGTEGICSFKFYVVVCS